LRYAALGKCPYLSCLVQTSKLFQLTRGGRGPHPEAGDGPSGSHPTSSMQGISWIRAQATQDRTWSYWGMVQDWRAPLCRCPPHRLAQLLDGNRTAQGDELLRLLDVRGRAWQDAPHDESGLPWFPWFQAAPQALEATDAQNTHHSRLPKTTAAPVAAFLSAVHRRPAGSSTGLGGHSDGGHQGTLTHVWEASVACVPQRRRLPLRLGLSSAW
jgi:hypothetical protein